MTIYHSDIAAVFSLNDQDLKSYMTKLKKVNMLVLLRNKYEKQRPQEQQTELDQILKSSSPAMASSRQQQKGVI